MRSVVVEGENGQRVRVLESHGFAPLALTHALGHPRSLRRIAARPGRPPHLSQTHRCARPVAFTPSAYPLRFCAWRPWPRSPRLLPIYHRVNLPAANQPAARDGTVHIAPPVLPTARTHAHSRTPALAHCPPPFVVASAARIHVFRARLLRQPQERCPVAIPPRH